MHVAPEERTYRFYADDHPHLLDKLIDYRKSNQGAFYLADGGARLWLITHLAWETVGAKIKDVEVTVRQVVGLPAMRVYETLDIPNINSKL